MYCLYGDRHPLFPSLDCVQPADASKRNAVRDLRLTELETQLRAGVEELFVRSYQSEQPEVPDGLVRRGLE
jgi:hypothetical protein